MGRPTMLPKEYINYCKKKISKLRKGSFNFIPSTRVGKKEEWGGEIVMRQKNDE